MTEAGEVFSKPGYLTITSKENPDHIYFAWESFDIPLDDCVKAFQKAENAMTERGVFHIITNTASVKQALRPEVAKWWGEVCMPSLAKCGVKLIVSVVPAGAPLGSTDVFKTITMKKAASVKDAESLIRAFGREESGG